METFFETTVCAIERIVGGQLANDNQFPFQVAIIRTFGRDNLQDFWCSGTLIHPEWILSAAHCFRDADSGFEVAPSELFAVIGISDLLAFGGYQRNISQLIIHPDYTNISISDRKDIALLKLNLLVPTPRIQIATPQLSSLLEVDGSTATVSGWGGVSEYSYESLIQRNLRYVSIPLINLQVCNVNASYLITNNYLCAGSVGKDACSGDSGGPLIVPFNGSFVQLGIVSTSSASSEPYCAGTYGVYTRISPFYNWIISYTGSLDVVPMWTTGGITTGRVTTGRVTTGTITTSIRFTTVIVYVSIITIKGGFTTRGVTSSPLTSSVITSESVTSGEVTSQDLTSQYITTSIEGNTVSVSTTGDEDTSKTDDKRSRNRRILIGLTIATTIVIFVIVISVFIFVIKYRKSMTKGKVPPKTEVEMESLSPHYKKKAPKSGGYTRTTSSDSRKPSEAPLPQEEKPKTKRHHHHTTETSTNSSSQKDHNHIPSNSELRKKLEEEDRKLAEELAFGQPQVIEAVRRSQPSNRDLKSESKIPKDPKQEQLYLEQALMDSD